MDEADLGNIQVELNEQRSIKYSQQNASRLEVNPIEQCLYCAEKFEENSLQRWCDKFCHQEWERRQRKR